MYDYGPHNARLPADDGAAAGAAQMLEMFSSFQDRLVGLCTDQADLTRFATIPPGSMVGSYQVPAIWMRTTVTAATPSGWYTVWRLYPTVTDVSAVSAAPNFSVSTVNLARTGDVVDLRVSVTRTSGPTLTGGADSGLGDTALWTVNLPTYQPASTKFESARTSSGMGVVDLGSTGGCSLTALMGTIATDNNVHVSSTFIGKAV